MVIKQTCQEVRFNWVLCYSFSEITIMTPCGYVKASSSYLCSLELLQMWLLIYWLAHGDESFLMMCPTLTRTIFGRSVQLKFKHRLISTVREKKMGLQTLDSWDD